MKILIIEDNSLISKTLQRILSSHYSIDTAREGQIGLHMARTGTYDAILLDLNLPDISGEDICTKLRKDNIDTPIIVISGRGEVKDRISLLNMGADDYLIKPFNIEELRARIDVAVRRINNKVLSGKIVAGDLVVDTAARTVTRDDKPIVLRRKEFDLLEYLMYNQGQTLTRPMIMEHIWDSDENLWANVVDVHIKHLRDKVDRPYGSHMIKTVHGLGYKFVPLE